MYGASYVLEIKIFWLAFATIFILFYCLFKNYLQTKVHSLHVHTYKSNVFFFKNRFLMIKKNAMGKIAICRKIHKFYYMFNSFRYASQTKDHAYCCTLFANEDKVVRRISDRKIRRSVIDLLIQKEHIFFYSTFMCNMCAKFGEQCRKYKEGHNKKLPLKEDSQFSIFSMIF